MLTRYRPSLVKDGKSHDTSMGLTPLDGGQCAKAELILNKQGGLQALAGISNFGEATANPAGGDKARLAYDVFLDRLMNYIGAYVVKARGAGRELDGIVFAGGIGEKSAKLREDVGRMFEWMGCVVDRGANEAVASQKHTATEIADKVSRLKLFVCQTDEEGQCAKMAKHIYEPKDLD